MTRSCSAARSGKMCCWETQAIPWITSGLCLDGEAAAMTPEGLETRVGTGGVRLSGSPGQLTGAGLDASGPRRRRSSAHLRRLAADSVVV